MSIFQLGKLRHRVMTRFTLCHTAHKQKIWALNPGRLTPECVLVSVSCLVLFGGVGLVDCELLKLQNHW